VFQMQLLLGLAWAGTWGCLFIMAVFVQKQVATVVAHTSCTAIIILFRHNPIAQREWQELCSIGAHLMCRWQNVAWHSA
jgi:hypothetical protein